VPRNLNPQLKLLHAVVVDFHGFHQTQRLAPAVRGGRSGEMNVSILKRLAAGEEAKPSAQPSDLGSELTAIGELAKERLRRRMTRECEVMAEYALSLGLTVPVEVLQRLDQALSADSATLKGDRSSLGAAESNAGSGLALGADSMQTSALVSLALAHSALALVIAPATPEAVRLLADERLKHPKLCVFGPLPVVRRMLGLAILSLAVLLGVSLSPHVNTTTLSKTLLEQSGYDLFLAEVFLLSAGSLGSCFANLQKINSFISDGTYDPKFQSTYWMRWVMGVISGVVLAQLVYDVFFPDTKTGSLNGVVPTSLGQPILALLGGYSFDVVYGILNHTINSISRFFLGARDGLEANRERARLAETTAQERLTSAAYLAAQQPALAPNANIDEKGQSSQPKS
jgi:hypothetical protein